MTKFLYIAILVMPWLIIPMPVATEQMRTPKAAFFDIICLVIIASSISRGVKFLYSNKYLSWIAALVFASFFFNFYYPYMFSGLVRPWVIEPMIHFVLGLWAVMVILSVCDAEDFRKIACAFCVSAVCVSVYGILQCTRILDPVGSAGFYNDLARNSKMTGLIGNYHLTGCFLAMCAPMFLPFLREKRFLVGFVLTVVAVIMSTADMALIAAFIPLGVVALIKYRKNTRLLLIALGLCAVVGGVYVIWNYKHIMDTSIFSRRLYLWQRSFEYIKTNPLFGRGLGVFKTFQIMDGPTLAIEAHNDYIERIVEIGLLGLSFIVMLILNTLRKFNYKPENTLGFAYLGAFLSFLIVAFGSFPLEQAPLALIGILAWCGTEKL